METVHVSKHFKNGSHYGFRKFVYGRMFHLITGTTPAHEERAKAIATRLVSKGKELEKKGGIWTEDAISKAYEASEVPAVEKAPCTAIVLFRNQESPARAAVQTVVIPAAAPIALPPAADMPVGLYQAMEAYKAAERLRSKSHDTSHTNAENNVYRIEWSKEGISDRLISELRVVADLKAWRGHFTARPIGRCTGKPISPYTAAGICQTIRHFLDWCDAERIWVPCYRWKDAFRGISVRKLSTAAERNKNKRGGFFNFTQREMRIAWHHCIHENRVLFGLGLWTGHTQNELATILLEGEFVEWDGDLYLERDRTKTGIYGRWWIPPELAVLVRERLKKTPHDPKANPRAVAFLTRDEMPLVHFGRNNERKRSDSVAQWWKRTLEAAGGYGVRYKSFKYLRKTMAQQVRNHLDGKACEDYVGDGQT